MTDKELHQVLWRWGVAGGFFGVIYIFLVKDGDSYLGVEGVLGAWLTGAFGGGIGAAAFYCLAGIFLSSKIAIKFLYTAGIAGCLGILTAVDSYRLEKSNRLEIEPARELIVYVDNRRYTLSTRNPDQYDGTDKARKVVSYYERSLAKYGKLDVVIIWRPHALETSETIASAKGEASAKAEALAKSLEAVSGEKHTVRGM